MRGRKLLSGMIGALQATVFILAVSAVLSGPLNAFTVAGYALGFAAGVIVGMVAEERLAIGYSYLRVYSPSRGKAIADGLRQSGHAVTEFTARGKDGLLTVVNCVIARRDAPHARDLVEGYILSVSKELTRTRSSRLTKRARYGVGIFAISPRIPFRNPVGHESALPGVGGTASETGLTCPIHSMPRR
jgi:hypothetical protein